MSPFCIILLPPVKGLGGEVHFVGFAQAVEVVVQDVHAGVAGYCGDKGEKENPLVERGAFI